MKISTIVFLLLISANMVAQIFQNTFQIQRLVVGQINPVKLSVKLEEIERIEISRLGDGDYTDYFEFDIDFPKQILNIKPRSSFIVIDTIYHDWVEWEKKVRAGQMYCEFYGDTMYVMRQNEATGEYEEAIDIRDTNNPIKDIVKRNFDLAELSSMQPFKLIIKTEDQYYEQYFECFTMEQRPFAIFCGKNSGVLSKAEITVNSELWVNFEISAGDRYHFPSFEVRKPEVPTQFIVYVLTDQGMEDYSVYSNTLYPNLLEAIQKPESRELIVQSVRYSDQNKQGFSMVEDGLRFSLR
jgi:hypothetical protein